MFKYFRPKINATFGKVIVMGTGGSLERNNFEEQWRKNK